MNYLDITNFFSLPSWLIYLLLVWSLVWDGVALWKAARNKDKVWFIVLLVLNTVGILEILYIFVFSKREYKQEQAKNVNEANKKEEK